MNGVSSRLSLSPSMTVDESVKFSSSEGQTLSRTLTLSNSDVERVSRIVVHAGALIDRIELHSLSGNYIAVGGHGGNRMEVCLIM